jgi:cell division protein FtsB
VNLNRVITSFYVVLFVGLGLAACFLFVEARSEYNRLRQTEVLNRRRLTEAQARLQEQEKILERLRTDPAYVEKVIRTRLGYAKPNEFIFRFPE